MRRHRSSKHRMVHLVAVLAIFMGIGSGLIQPTPTLAFRSCVSTDIAPYANMQNCNLPYLQLINMNFPYINFFGANLFDSILSGTTFTGANFYDAIVTGSLLVSTELTGATFASASLGKSDLRLATAVGTSFSSANLAGANLEGGSFISANFNSADLNGADLTDADFTAAKFANANLAGANLASAVLTGATLGTANLANIRSGNIVGTPSTLPYGWALKFGYLMGPGANLSDANLTGRDLRTATLNNARFTNTNLLGARLTKSKLTNAKWNNTICPDGTNSDNHGDSCVNNLTPAPYSLVGGATSTNGEKSGRIRDGDSGTVWRTKSTVSRPNTAWVSVILPSNVSISQVRWTFGVGNIADSFKVQANTSCTAGVTSGWTTLTTRTNATTGTWQAYTPSATFKACQIRFLFTNPNNDMRLGGIAEVQVRRPGGAI